MSPIDDELRTALQRRATALAPAPDPLTGIERQAARMRRTRLGACVAGSVLAVAAVATAVPLLTAPTAPARPPVALAPPSALPSASAYALDPAAPWAYRGTPLAELGQGFLDTVTREYAARVGGAAAALTPLWGQVDEPSAQSELVFVATVDGGHRWGFVRSGHAGPEFLLDEPLTGAPVALAAAVPGDEVARLLVVAAPTAGALQHDRDGNGAYTPMASLAPGVAVAALEGDPGTASYRVLDPSGTVLVQAGVPDVAPPFEPSGPPLSQTATPRNVLDWPLRGAVPADLLEAAEAAAAEQAGVAPGQLASRPLFGTERDGRFYGLLQVWSGGDARLFAWTRDLDDGGTTSALFPPTAPAPAVLAFQFDDVLVVVPEPRTGQVLYSPDGGAPVAVPDQGTEAAVLVERAHDASGDRLLVLDGDGDPERPLYRGTVAELLAASSS